MKQVLRFLLWTMPLLAACGSLRNAEQEGRMAPAIDITADNLIAEGKLALRAEKYPEAFRAFEQARLRPFNRSTTGALYLSGLAAYYQGQYPTARDRFAQLSREFPKSRYLQDAIYHEALIQLASAQETERVSGLQRLTDLYAGQAEESLRRDIWEQAERAAFGSLSAEALEVFAEQAAAPFRRMFAEALIYKLVADKRIPEARSRYQAYLQAGGEDSDFLRAAIPADKPQTLRPSGSPPLEPGIIKIGLVLPLYLNRTDLAYLGEVPPEAAIGLEFYEGFKLAIEEGGVFAGRKIFLKVYDSRRDSMVAARYLGQMDSLGINLLVGDIFNGPSRTLSAWAEQRQVPQIIPISPTSELVRGKQWTFMAHPSAFTHGEQLAEYAFGTLSLRRIFVFTDQQGAAAELANGFMGRFASLGGSIDTVLLDAAYARAMRQISAGVSRVPSDPSVGVYIPLLNAQESSGLIINLLRSRARKVTVMGSPHFRTNYTALSRDLKDSYELIFTSSHMHDPEDLLYQRFHEQYVNVYKIPPSEHAIQGYDLGKYLIQVIQGYKPESGLSLADHLRSMPEYKGIHLDYFFGQHQNNQRVNIGQYTRDGIVRIR
ncbi:MAG: ABC transporter substrate-binding protein [Bacteroidia bacterium]|nr:ABC transporter substrate-binding protein [Bacteroidia bacterium]